MSPRTSAAHRSAAPTPYPRRASGQPKSTRQQFSACGACRMRRVRCDLKDLAPVSTSAGAQQPSCSNCRERNIKCVDEFAEIKAVKLLRRGRRLQQVEAVYGKVTDDPALTQNASASASAASGAKQSAIPQLRPEFLNSTFFRRFCVQRPIIDPSEFAIRYFDHIKGINPLNIEGQMLAMLLVAWAASFGINEYGDDVDERDSSPGSPAGPKFARDGDDELSDPKHRAWSLRAEVMVQEILTLVDAHGILRRPSWDGVRVLLLLLPLTEGIQSSIERRATYEATLSQIYSLCHLASPSSAVGSQDAFCDSFVRARTFWYAYTYEGMTTGLHGGRLLFDDDDLLVFQNSLPQYCATAVASSPSSAGGSSLPSPTCSSPMTPDFPFSLETQGHSRASQNYLLARRNFTLMLAVSAVCRAVHTHLTGPRALRGAETGAPVREDAIMNIWDNLSRCWDDFEALRHEAGATVGGGLVRGEDIERFVSGWQVFIFESFNVIREALKHRVDMQSSTSPHSGRVTPSDRAVAVNLHAFAVRRCRLFLPRVIDILRRHLAVPLSGFFAHDTGLIRDGCYFAGMMLAQSDLDGDIDMDIKCEDGTRWDTDVEEGVDICLRALGEIRWVYSNSLEQVKSLRIYWEARINRDNDRQRSTHKTLPHSGPRDLASTHPRPLSLISAGGQVRPHLPPLSVSFPRAEGGPDTALTDDSPGSWTTYTPPTTSGSMTSTIATQRSASPASPPPALSPMKRPVPQLKTEDISYAIQDLNPSFTYSVDDATSGANLVGPGLGLSQSWAPYSHQQNGQAAGHGYLDPSMIYTGSVSDDGCPHFGSDCSAFYH
ncbi:hypothetical protein ID866_5490 [Astraeus odoratus]|nr:hypothetical protein ID866_5490 [Astraeus odoratus]